MGVIRPEVTGMFGGKILRNAALSAVVALTSVTMPFATHAAWVTVTGSSFDVSYDDQAIGAYGTPLILGDTVVFTPSDMSAELFGENLSPFTTSILITPKSGANLDELQLVERGDYSTNIDTTFSVDARLFVADAVDPNANSDFFAVSHEFTDAGPTTLEFWDFSETFAVADYTDGFLLTLQNSLGFELNSSSFGSVFIQKKYIGIKVGSATAVPVPGTMFLMGSALAMLVVARKRRHH